MPIVDKTTSPVRKAGQDLLSDTISRIGWIIVVVAALSISTWSLFWLGRRVGMPIPLAAVISCAFDGGAIVAADLCIKWAKIHGISGFSARAAMLLFGGSSAWLNYQHAILANLPTVARYLFAMPPIIVMITLELHLRFEYKNALKRSGSLPKSLPSYSKWAWLLYPLRTVGTIKKLVRVQIDSTNPDLQTSNPMLITVDSRIIRAWANDRGMQVPELGPLPHEIINAYHAQNAITANPERKVS